LLRWRTRDDPAIFCAFDLIEADGRDLRDEPIEARKTELARLLTGCQPLALGSLTWVVAVEDVGGDDG
jgi:ATP-dependent DNA ligase